MAQERSVWLYLGLGCLIIVVLGAVVAVIGGFFLYRGVKSLEAGLRDPATRTAKVKKTQAYGFSSYCKRVRARDLQRPGGSSGNV